jgi:hypothetical protein
MHSDLPLPEWIRVLQALLVPAVAIAGVWIALQQMHITRVKLRHDLFDRRFAVLQACQNLILTVTINANIDGDTYQSFAIAASTARFLFDDDLFAYLQDVRTHATKLITTKTVLPDMPPGDKKAAAAARGGTELKWLLEQADELPKRFEPFLQLERRWWSWGPLLR